MAFEMKPHSRTFHGLDALRGVAAVAVLLFHASAALNAPWLAPSGGLAVDVFFVMSGFVIAYSYEHKIPELGVGRFMAARLIRFLPLFYLGGALGLVRLGLLALTGEPDAGLLASLAYFLFLPAPPGSAIGGSISPLNGPGWSLLLEIYINLAYAVLLPRLSTRVVLAVSGAAGVALALGLLRSVELGGPHWSDLASGSSRVIFSFSVGVAIYRLRERLVFGLSDSWPVLVAFSLAAFVPPSIAWDAMFIFIVSPLLVAFALRLGRENWLARYGAASSYCIYAIHWPLLLILNGVSHRLQLGTAFLGIPFIVALLVAAPIIDRRFDSPLRAVLKKKLSPAATLGGTAAKVGSSCR